MSYLFTIKSSLVIQVMFIMLWMMLLLSRVDILINEFKWHIQEIRFGMMNANEGKGGVG